MYACYPGGYDSTAVNEGCSIDTKVVVLCLKDILVSSKKRHKYKYKNHSQPCSKIEILIGLNEDKGCLWWQFSSPATFFAARPNSGNFW